MSTPRDWLDIEALVIAKLTADVAAAKSVQPYAGQLDDVVEGRLVKGFPLLAVLFVGDAPEQIDGPNYHMPTDFAVLAVAHTLRGPEDTRVGAGLMVRAARASLVNARLASNLECVLPGPASTLYSTPTVTAIQMAFSVAWDQGFQWQA
jgi:phage gp37-like protein